jgi:predicted oxidoreductase
MERRPLGSSGLEVSRLSLGSWRTFERIPRDDGLAVMLAAREHGFNFLDDARYNDETGTAPIPSGYSEVLFGATSPAQIADNMTVLDVDPAVVQRILEI